MKATPSIYFVRVFPSFIVITSKANVQTLRIEARNAIAMENATNISYKRMPFDKRGRQLQRGKINRSGTEFRYSCILLDQNNECRHPRERKRNDVDKPMSMCNETLVRVFIVQLSLHRRPTFKRMNGMPAL
mmetsp:Transcript_56083/g.167852  ORF Transcript_56083/g.167852 Transcript_56083/m.167852 type:complete len:131 (+) Transcript_56083:897-1289(+)